MKHMSIIMSAVVLCLTVSVPFIGSAQTADQTRTGRELLMENPLRAANAYYSYEAPAVQTDTPAPEGFEPFYVSHYGRHGSRYHTSDRYISVAKTVLDTLHKQGLLTSDGEGVLSALQALAEVHEGMSSFLTQKGAREHQGIAARLYERCPQVFNQPDRKEVLATSTAVGRCIQSMSNFMLSLKGCAPSLEMSMYSGEKYSGILIKEPLPAPPAFREVHNAIYDSVYRAVFDPSRIRKAWFTDSEKAEKFMRNGIHKFLYDVFYAGGIAQCMDEELPCVYDYFTFDELYNIWYADNIQQYNNYNNTLDNMSIFTVTAVNILRDFVERADEALSPGSHRAADFRFGHDSGVMPFMKYIEIEGNVGMHHMTEAHDLGWYCFEQVPMGVNFQMIFYRNASGEVIVKALHNEKEVSFPRLEPYAAPYYYSWKDLRAYFDNLLPKDPVEYTWPRP